MHALRHLLEQCRGELSVGWVLGEVNRNEKLLSLRIDITDIDSTLVREEDPVALSCQDLLASSLPSRMWNVRREEPVITMR